MFIKRIPTPRPTAFRLWNRSVSWLLLMGIERIIYVIVYPFAVSVCYRPPWSCWMESGFYYSPVLSGLSISLYYSCRPFLSTGSFGELLVGQLPWLGYYLSMSINLKVALEAHINKIRKQQAVWVRLDNPFGDDTWYHTYDKKVINERVEKIRQGIQSLDCWTQLYCLWWAVAWRGSSIPQWWYDTRWL